MLDLSDARRVMERCDILGGISEQSDCLTRRFATAAMREANTAVAGWMRDAGMGVRQDSVGNLIGRYEACDGGARTLLLGSHLDTVRDAGRYDGPLGVLVALALVERLRARGQRLLFALDVVAFADEEGLRYHTSYLGSRALAGAFDPADLQREDEDGIAMSAAIRDFGGDPAAISRDKRDPDTALAYCEVHIEQGPVLEHRGLPVGVVSTIMGQSRFDVEFVGEAGHAGTVPMDLRRDALCAAAEFVLAVEGLARADAGLVATVGQLVVGPGASNVIPGRATFSLDARHLDDAARDRACDALHKRAISIGARRGVAVEWREVQTSVTTACAPELSAQLSRAIEVVGYEAMSLPSGAGHDAVAMSALAPVAMLFVRCKGGVSHNPAESVAVEDVGVALDVMDAFLAKLVDPYNLTVDSK
jgi:allantoate deiminase